MRLLPSDPDVETIVSRIMSGDINLQPDFQRGEVWGRTKKQRLIDSILREWHVPPIHVIENPKTRKQEVLDGQQRLASIRDFVEGIFPVEGNTEPLEPTIQALDGMFYAELPGDWKRRFNQFTIRLFRIVDYLPSEPAELFFRLNQPTSLTGAEQRNAFFGPVREQIKELVEFLSTEGLNKDVLTFSNARMSYDDVVSRTTLAVERGTLAEKITSSDLDALYRRDSRIDSNTLDLVRAAIRKLAVAAHEQRSFLPKFNKATLFSWLVFLVRGSLADNFELAPRQLGGFLADFEAKSRRPYDFEPLSNSGTGTLQASLLFAIYETRASARVADVSSVILRDAVIWLMFEEFCNTDKHLPLNNLPFLKRLHDAVGPRRRYIEDDQVARRLIECGWGSLR